MRDWVMNLAAVAVDQIWDLKTYRASNSTPAPKIVAHRGAWDKFHGENTLAAFSEARKLGAWGIELDVHFSQDGVPIVHHDQDLLRCHGHPGVLREMNFKEIRKVAPNVPALEEVLALSGLHFFIEIKTFLTDTQLAQLQTQLKRFTPVRDFHLLSLDDQLVKTPQLPPEAWVLVGELALKSMVETSLNRGLGGVAGHFLGMKDSLVERLHARGQKAGAGFIPTPNLYQREWSRGIDWVFTNSMAALQKAALNSY